jgi:ABC-2 type transport system ATP-binding protein
VVEDLSDLVEVVAHGESWVRYRTDQPHLINPQIVRQLASQGVQVVTLSEVPQMLEEVYLRVVQSDRLDDQVEVGSPEKVVEA